MEEDVYHWILYINTEHRLQNAYLDRDRGLQKKYKEQEMATCCKIANLDEEHPL